MGLLGVARLGVEARQGVQNGRRVLLHLGCANGLGDIVLLHLARKERKPRDAVQQFGVLLALCRQFFSPSAGGREVPAIALDLHLHVQGVAVVFQQLEPLVGQRHGVVEAVEPHERLHVVLEGLLRFRHLLDQRRGDVEQAGKVVLE